MGRLTSARYEVVIAADFFDSDKLRTAIFCNYFECFRRFCGFFYSEMHVEIDHAGAESDLIYLRIGRKKFQIVKESSNDPFYYAQKVFEILAEECPKLANVIACFLSKKLWQLEIQFLFLKKDKVIRQKMLVNIRRILRGISLKYEDRHMSYLFCKLLVIQMMLEVDERKQRNRNFMLPKNSLYEIFEMISDEMRRYNYFPLFYDLLCQLSELQEDKDIVRRNYRVYLQELEEFAEHCNVAWECSVCYYQLGHFLEYHMIERSKMQDMGKLNYAKQYNRELAEVHEMYLRSYRYDNNNYRAMFKLALSEYESFTVAEELHNLKELKEKLRELEGCGHGELMIYIYMVKVLARIGYIYMQDSRQLRNAIKFLTTAEKIFEKIMKYLELVMDCGDNNQEELNHQIAVLEEYLEILLLYQKLTSAYVQEEGVYSEMGSKYERKYFQLERKQMKMLYN